MNDAEKIQKAFIAKKKLLSDREQDIICRYYGLGLEVRHTLQDLGEKHQVTRERIRQIKVLALAKLGILN